MILPHSMHQQQQHISFGFNTAPFTCILDSHNIHYRNNEKQLQFFLCQRLTDNNDTMNLLPSKTV